MKFISILFISLPVLAACADRERTVYLPSEGRAEGTIQFERNSEFDGETLRVFLSLQDGSSVSVDTTDDAIRTMPGVTPIPGHRAQDWTFLKETEDGTSVAYGLVSWDPDNPADYLMAGWWAQFPNQHPPDLSFRGSEQYAIFDGPELDHRVAPRLPAEGTATYLGPAGGLYTYEAGSDWGEDEGAYVIDEYQGTIALTADFTDGTVSGCIGCVGDLATTRAHFSVFLGQEPIDVGGIAADYEVHLATAIIRKDGTFERDRVTVRHPERTVTHSEGDWGGALSRLQDTDGNPRLVGGLQRSLVRGERRQQG